MTELRIGGAAGFPARVDQVAGVLEVEEVEGVSRSALEHLLALEGIRNPRLLERRGGVVRFRFSPGTLFPAPKP